MLQNINIPTLPTDRANNKLSMLSLFFKSPKTESDFQKSLSTFNQALALKKSYTFLVIFHLLILFIYFASYLENHPRSKSNQSEVFKFILIVTMIVIDIGILITAIFSSYFFMKRLYLLKANYFMSAAILIVNDDPFQCMVLGSEGSEVVPCLIGVISIALINAKVFEFGFRTQVPGNLALITLYAVLTLLDSQSCAVILENILLFIVLTYLAVDSYLKELTSRMLFISQKPDLNEEFEKAPFAKEESSSELKVQDCVAELMNILPHINLKFKEILSKVIRSLKILSNDSRMKNQYSVYEEISDDLDEEDKIYIMQSCLPMKVARPGKMRRFKQRESIDKIIEKVLSQDAIIILKQVSYNWSINMFEFSEKVDNSPVTVLGKYSLNLYSLITTFSIPEIKIGMFFTAIQSNYKNNNPYHNSKHAADVLCSALYLINNSDLMRYLSDLDMLIVIISHLAHDIAHPGFNNRFLINMKDPIALTCNFYIDNDISVLENMHCSLTFSLLADKDKNILESLSKEQYLVVRKWIIELILITDMAKHFEFLSFFKAKMYIIENLESTDCKLDALKLIIHAADIGHSAKETSLHKKWSNLVSEEFFTQGDIEKANNQAVSMYCDRETTILPKSQIGFLRNISFPLYDILCGFLNSPAINSNCLEQLKANIVDWEHELQLSRLKTFKEVHPRHEVYSPFQIMPFKSFMDVKTKP